MAANRRDSNDAAPKKTGRKRQQVRRHYKPSLGRYVDTYKRRGDPAVNKEATRGTGGAAEPVEPDAAAGRRPGVRLALALLLAAPLAAAGVLLAIRSHARQIDFEIRPAAEPHIVGILAGEPGHLVTLEDDAREAQVRAAAARVTDALDRHPRRLVVLEVDGLPLSFHLLRAGDQRALMDQFGGGADVVYEASLAGFLEDVIDAVALERPQAMLSVRGLPVEPRNVDPEWARMTNVRYAAVIEALDPFVSDHSVLMADTSLTEELIALKAFPEGLHHRSHRPLLFRTNGRWRVLYDQGEPAPLGLATGSLAEHAQAARE